MRKIILTAMFLAIFIIGCSKAGEQEVFNEEQTEEETVSEELPAEQLQKGDESEQVLILQEALQEIGYPVETTGKYDNLTTWAITDIQLQYEDLIVSGVYTEQIKDILTQVRDGKEKVTVGSKLKEPVQPDQFTDIVENPYEILVLVNKNYTLSSDFEPHDLVVPDVPFPFSEEDPKKNLRQEAATALEELFSAAESDGIDLFAQSGYRSYDRQEVIFASNVERHGEEHANTYSAKAGESEHQTGLVMDVTAQSVGFDLNTGFGETKEGKWVNENADKYGFIIRYPEGKEAITKYQYEPWHLRYVGKKAAKEITEQNITLEEYLGAE